MEKENTTTTTHIIDITADAVAKCFNDALCQMVDEKDAVRKERDVLTERVKFMDELLTEQKRLYAVVNTVNITHTRSIRALEVELADEKRRHGFTSAVKEGLFRDKTALAERVVALEAQLAEEKRRRATKLDAMVDALFLDKASLGERVVALEAQLAEEKRLQTDDTHVKWLDARVDELCHEKTALADRIVELETQLADARQRPHSAPSDVEARLAALERKAAEHDAAIKSLDEAGDEVDETLDNHGDALNKLVVVIQRQCVRLPMGSAVSRWGRGYAYW